VLRFRLGITPSEGSSRIEQRLHHAQQRSRVAVARQACRGFGLKLFGQRPGPIPKSAKL
jgi:hypothetical protein